MSYYENRIKQLEARIEQMERGNRLKAIPVEAQLIDRIAELNKENATLKAEVERLKEGNECLGQMHDKEMERSAYLLEEFNRTTAWGRGLESDLSHARVEISFLKSEVERLDTLCKQLGKQP